MRRRKSSSSHVWPAFSDLLSGLLLTFLVIFLYQTSIIQSLRDENGKMVDISLWNRSEINSVKLQAQNNLLKKQLEELQKKLKNLKESLGASREMAHDVEQAIRRHGIDAELNQKSGSIDINASVMFQQSESSIPEGTQRELIMKIGQSLRAVLDDRDKSKLISAIMVIGHADQTGNWAMNQRISTRRANAIVELWNREILKGNNHDITGCTVPKLIAAGVGESRPLVKTQGLSLQERHKQCEHYLSRGSEIVVDSDGNPVLNTMMTGCKKNRRIEIMIVPKDPENIVIEGCP